VPLLGIASCLWLITTVPNYVLMIFLWYTLAMIVLYFVYGMHSSKLGKGEPQLAGPDLPEFPEDAGTDADGNPVVRP
jgi:APA family basic amino acid/polyamine antiporter